MIKQNLTGSGVGCLLVLLAPQFSGHSSSKGNEPSALYGSLSSTPKTATATRNADLVGVVKDSSGIAIKGATVYVYTARPRVGRSSFCPSCYADCGKHEVTDANGVFRIPSMSQTLLFRVLVVKDGFESQFVRDVDPLHGRVNISLQKTFITLEKKKRLVRGRILDPLGNPVVGAVVAPVHFKPSANPMGAYFGQIPQLSRLAITNKRGEFYLVSPSVGDCVGVRVSARGLATTNVAALIAGSASPQVVNVPWGVTVTGTVSSNSGKKVSDVVVRAVPAERKSVEKDTGWVEAVTDSVGKFTLYNVPANCEYKVGVKMDGLIKSNTTAVTQVLSTGHDDTVIENINLLVKPAAVIVGQVVLTDGKQIPVGTHVILGRGGIYDAQQSILSPTGKFTFRAVPQNEDVSLFVRIPGYHWADGTPPRSVIKTQVSSTSAAKTLTLSLTPDKK